MKKINNKKQEQNRTNFDKKNKTGLYAYLF